MRLEFWAAQGVPALVAMDTHAGVGLYHADLLDRSFLGGRETRVGGVAGRHVTAEPGNLEHEGYLAATTDWMSLRSLLSVLAQRKAVLLLNLPPSAGRISSRDRSAITSENTVVVGCFPKYPQECDYRGSTVSADNHQVRMSSRSRKGCMAQTKTGNRADRESLSVATLAQGCGIDEIAAELLVRWGSPCAPLPARQQADTVGWEVW